MAEYIKVVEKVKKKDSDSDYDGEEPGKRPANRLFIGVIDAIRALINQDMITKNAIRFHIKRAQRVEKSFAAEVMSITTYEEDKTDKRAYELTFMNEDMKGVDTPHNDTLVLTVNINTFDVKKVLIDPGSSLEIMYHRMFEKLRPPASLIQSADSLIFNFSGETV